MILDLTNAKILRNAWDEETATAVASLIEQLLDQVLALRSAVDIIKPQEVAHDLAQYEQVTDHALSVDKLSKDISTWVFLAKVKRARAR